MKSWPPFQGFLVLAALALLLIPTIRLTGGRPSSPPAVEFMAPESTDASKIAAHVTLRFAHAPERFTVLERGRPIWTHDIRTDGDAGQTEFDGTIMLRSDGGYADLAVAVVWPPGTPRTVVELDLLPDGAEGATRTAWGESEFTTNFSFPIE
jgi:hypothetical protein